MKMKGWRERERETVKNQERDRQEVNGTSQAPANAASTANERP